MDFLTKLIITDFIFLWTGIDPIGSIPVFIAATKSVKKNIKRRIALRAVTTAGVILLFFIVGGQIILEAMSVPLSAFKIAGGIVLFLFALTMVFGESKPEEEISDLENLKEKQNAVAVFPLAVPSVASPGAMMAVVLLTDNHRYQIYEQIVVACVLAIILLIQLLLFLLSDRIYRIIGLHGASIISRVMGLILASVAVNSVLLGIKDFFQI